jgi:hypothetical protein
MLSDTRHLRRAVAYLVSARAVHALATFGELRAISIEAPDVVLAEAKEIAAHSLARYLGGGDRRRLAEPILISILVGLQAVETAGATVPETDAISHSLKSQPSLFRLRGDAARWASDHHNQIVRLANAVIELRTVSTAQQCWLLDSKPTRRAA